MAAPCAFHPDADGVGACLRCAAFLCAECILTEDGFTYCRACYREMKLAALGVAAPRESAATGDGAPAPDPTRSRDSAGHECPACGERWAQPYCPLCALSFGPPPAGEEADDPRATEALDTPGSRLAPRPSFLRYVAQHWWGAIRHPFELFDAVARRDEVAYPLAYLWTIALPPLIASAWFERAAWLTIRNKGAAFAAATVATGPILAAAAVLSVWIYGLFLRGDLDPGRALRIVAFASAPMVLYSVPYLGGPVALVWTGALVALGLERVGGLPRARAWSALLSAAVTLWIVETAWRRAIAGLIDYGAADAVIRTIR
ncbi:MAG: YIP1 family protein [Myxococcales bacterium]|nr:YIP1 family protein [Myxococcales bacterium]